MNALLFLSGSLTTLVVLLSCGCSSDPVALEMTGRVISCWDEPPDTPGTVPYGKLDFLADDGRLLHFEQSRLPTCEAFKHGGRWRLKEQNGWLREIRKLPEVQR